LPAFDPMPVFNQAVIEIRYANGVVYLDHCGSLMVALEKALGEPFEGSVPQMTAAELSSDQERLAVRYGSTSLSVTQTWFETLARFQMIVPKAWHEVARALNVEHQVLRCGVRYLFMWKVASREKGEAMITKLGLVRTSDHWNDLKLDAAQFVPVRAFINGKGHRLRLSVDVVEQKIKGYIAKEHERYALPVALLLDLDYAMAGPTPRKLTPDVARSFAVETWDAGRSMALRIGEAFEACQ